jgi:hypothetical protein
MKISWTYGVKNEAVLHRVKEESNEGKLTRLINLASKLPYKHVIEEKKEDSGRRGRRRKQLLGDLKDKIIYWNLKVETPDRPLRRTSFGRVGGPVARLRNESRGINN